ncbi:MAG: hypothetical protein E6K16_02640 [Methanobacteriota archaeon]|nr:MAG: hypothetical protein E6K16_02640 [Euryarchaeota archaeon]
MDVTARAATKEDVPALVALHTSQNEFGGRWFENPFAGGKEAKYEDLTPAQRWLHGGPGMDPELLALQMDRIYDAHGAVLVTERGGGVVGAVELWPGEEPLPFGRYLSVVDLTTKRGGTRDVEPALLHAAAREARGRDLRALDLSPIHAGGDAARLIADGFHVLAEHRTVHLEAGRKMDPPEYSVVSTAPSYIELRESVALDHTGPPSFRIGNLANEWSAGLLADVSKPFGALLRVDFATLGVTGRVLTWLPEREAELDLWVPTAALGNLPWLRRAVAAAVDHVGKRHRVTRHRATVRAHQVPALHALRFEDGTDPDPWLRRHLSG